MRNASTGSNLKRITQSVTVTPGVPFRQTVIAKEGVFQHWEAESYQRNMYHMTSA
jgi:hypothetical protein